MPNIVHRFRIILLFLFLIFGVFLSLFITSGIRKPITTKDGFAQINTGFYPLKIAGEGKTQYLADSSGKPFFINGDTAWSLIVELSREDALLYLDDRVQKGYNLILVNLIEHRYSTHPPSNFYNQVPFTTAGNFNTPNEEYFAHADWVIQEAGKKGVTVLLDPIYLGYQCNSDGWCGEIKNSSLATMRNWGKFVGNRYKNFPNIIWLIGGDDDPRQYGVADKIREVALGINETDINHLISAHNANGQSASDVWGNETWLDLNNVYTWQDTYPMAQEEYNRSNFKPIFLLETVYENYNNSTPTYLRSQAYWSILSGSNIGHIFGNCQIWGFSRGYCSDSWKTQLNSEGSKTLALVGKLFTSREFNNLVPDQSLVVSRSGNGHVSIARTTNGHSIIAYMPSQMTIGLDLTPLSSQNAKLWWYNPRDGTSFLAGNYIVSSNQSFTPPSSGDWILVADDSSLNLPPPGSNSTIPTYTPTPTIVIKPGDVNMDGRVDILDFQLLSNSFGKSTGQTSFNINADFNKDGTVNILDFQLLSNNFGK